MRKVKYTNQDILKDAKKYLNRRDWKKYNPAMYELARPRNRNILDKATSHMEYLPNSSLKWTTSAIMKDAKKYLHKSDWIKESGGAYNASKKSGCFKKATSHMKKPNMIQKWTKQKVIRNAKKFITISDWTKKSGGAVNSARDNYWIKEATAHMIRPVGKGLRIWTKEKIMQDAKKYKHRVSWGEKSGGAYAAAQRMGVLKLSTKHMTRPIVENTWNKGLKRPNKWSDQQLKKSASKYTSLYEWRKKEGSAYVTASQRKLLDDVTGHMTKLKRYRFWSKQRVLESALKYENKVSWLNNDSTAYSMAHVRGWLKEATKHMVALGSHYYRCIYSLEIIGQKKIYIGLTYNFKRRIRDHLKSKRFVELAKKYGEKTIKTKQLTKYEIKEKAILSEERFVNIFRKKGYEILNLSQTGGLGGTTIKWTKEKILENSKKYRYRSEWSREGRGAYAAAKKMKIFHKATSHMVPPISIKKWDEKSILLSTKGFKVISHWKEKYPGAQGAAIKLGIYKKISKKMVDGRFIRGKNKDNN